VNQQSGITLLEVLLALGLIGAGLLALASAFPMGMSGLEAGKQQTVAAFLAEQRLEEIKGTAFANITTANFPAENYGAAGLPVGYRRTVAITNNPGTMTNAVRVDVSVFYRPVMSWGVLTAASAERQVTISGVIAVH
jgi:Tfp pilus assembly protein PilV